MVLVMGFDRHNRVELCPVYPGFPVFLGGGGHDRPKDVVGVDVLVGVEEAHAHVLLLVVAGILVPLKLQATSSLPCVQVGWLSQEGLGLYISWGITRYDKQ